MSLVIMTRTRAKKRIADCEAQIARLHRKIEGEDPRIAWEHRLAETEQALKEYQAVLAYHDALGTPDDEDLDTPAPATDEHGSNEFDEQEPEPESDALTP